MSTEHIFVAIEDIPYSADKLYEYALPAELQQTVSVGTMVLCPFGGGNRKVRGIVFDFGPASTNKVKQIFDVYDLNGFLTQDQIRLCRYMKNKYFCTFFDAAKTMMPAGVIGGVDRYYSLCAPCADLMIQELFDRNQNWVLQKELVRQLPRQKYYQVLKWVREHKAREVLKFKNMVSDRMASVFQITSAGEVYAAECRKKQTELAKKHLAVLDFLKENDSCTAKEILYMTGLSASVLNTLRKRGMVSVTVAEQLRDPLMNKSLEYNPQPVVLNDTQKQAAEEILKNSQTGKTHLLYGVTGSGKTHVFMAVIDELLARGKSALVLLPEISLTLQIIERFYLHYGPQLAVLHSALSAGERYDEYKRIRSGHAKVVVGTRSAVFAPMQDLGIIIIDEEQEHTYKSDMTPKYHARDIAAFLVARKKALLVLASATPSFESYTRAMKGAIGYSELSGRFNKQPLPKVLVSDTAMEQVQGNLSLISTTLATELQKNLEQQEQTILFMNRRGYNSFVSCPKCKFVFRCPNCGIALTYHSVNDRLVCHYCGYSQPATGHCPDCGEKTLRYSGFGTQKAESELRQFFPGIRILRMDADTVGGKSTRDEILTAFARKEYDVLLGTQMITKGLDFPDVTLVGVLMADMSLYSSDFRAYEKTFSLITQVVGRAGRAQKQGRAVIQTFSPEHMVLEYAFRQDYKGFYAEESALRKSLVYPPYCDICQVVFLADGVSAAFEGAEAFVHKIELLLQDSHFDQIPVSIIRPRQTAVPKVDGRDRVRVLIKCRDDLRTREMLNEAYLWFLKEKVFKNTSISMDINPSMII